MVVESRITGEVIGSSGNGDVEDIVWKFFDGAIGGSNRFSIDRNIYCRTAIIFILNVSACAIVCNGIVVLDVIIVSASGIVNASRKFVVG